MRFMLGMLLTLAMGVPLLAQKPEVDRAEVLRLGNTVQHVDGIRSDPADAFVEAMSPPASDNDKWFISVLTMPGCRGCTKLKSEWQTNQWLLALADPQNPKRSWAHYNVYSSEDESQTFRFENIQITAYPTILVQPPRNGRYGEPTTVVFQGTYGGDPEKLARQITEAMRQYVAKLAVVPLRQAPRVTQTGVSQGMIGVDPPWAPVPKVEPQLPSVTPVFPDGRPLIPPNLQPTPQPNQPSTEPTSGTWGTATTVAASSVVTLLLAFGIPWGLKTIRQIRLERGQTPLLNDAQFQQLLTTLAGLATIKAATSQATASSADSAQKSST